MTNKFSSNRRNFLKGTVAAAGAATLGSVLRGNTYNALASGLRPAQVATPASAPANKMSAAMPPLKQDIVLHTPQVVKEIAPSVVAEVWTFEGSAPGPILHVKEGEKVNFT